MLPADWLELIAEKEREIKRSPNPPKRRQPKVTRMSSRRQRTAESQTKNPIKAIYSEESKWNMTPTKPEEWRGTHEVGPGDVHNPNSSWRTGKPTIETVSPSYNKVTPRKHGGGGRKTEVDTVALVAEYLIGTAEEAHGDA